MTLWHDVDEIFTGDIPGPAKRALTHKKSAWSDTLEKWMGRVFGDFRHTRTGQGMSAERENLAKAIIKTSDELDAACEMSAEWAMGNRNAQPLIEQRQAAMLDHYDLLVQLAGERMLDVQRAGKLRAMLVMAVLSAAEPSRAPKVISGDSYV